MPQVSSSYSQKVKKWLRIFENVAKEMYLVFSVTIKYCKGLERN